MGDPAEFTRAITKFSAQDEEFRVRRRANPLPVLYVCQGAGSIGFFSNRQTKPIFSVQGTPENISIVLLKGFTTERASTSDGIIAKHAAHPVVGEPRPGAGGEYRI